MKPFSASLVILWVVVGLLAPASTAAQSESPEARELASLAAAVGTFDSTYTEASTVATSMMKSSLERRLGRQLSDDESRQLGALFLRLIKETVPQSDLETNYVDRVSRYYSPQELKDLVAFYRTPLGTKVLRFQVATNAEEATGAQRIAGTHFREFRERFAAEFAREFPAINRELERKQRQ
jgi:hypothetical protein